MLWVIILFSLCDHCDLKSFKSSDEHDLCPEQLNVTLFWRMIFQTKRKTLTTNNLHTV